MKKQSKSTAAKRIELDREQIADLEVDDDAKDAIQGGGRSGVSGRAGPMTV